MKDIAHKALKYYLRSFPVSKGKHRVCSLLWQPLSFGNYTRETTLRQAEIRINCDLTEYLQRHLYFFGSYEEDDCAYWTSLARESQVVFDLGANVGLYSLLAASANIDANIHAFEPTPEIFSAFLENLNLNSFRNVIANQKAVGRTTGTAILKRCRGDSASNGGMNFVSDAASDETGPVQDVIDIVTLDDYCSEKGISHIDLMKIDIEGGEYDALKGAQQLLSRKAIDYLFVELVEWAANRGGHSTSEVKELLLECGYGIYKVKSGGLVTVPWDEVHFNGNVVACAQEPAPFRTLRLNGAPKPRSGRS